MLLKMGKDQDKLACRDLLAGICLQGICVSNCLQHMIGQIDRKHEAKCVQGGFFYILKVCKLLRVSEAEELVRDSF